MTYPTNSTDTVEMQLREKVSQLKAEAGGLRVALIRVLDEVPREHVSREALNQAYQALEGNNA